MPKKTNLSASRKPLNLADKDTKLGRDLIAGAKKILEHVRGEKIVEAYILPAQLDVKAIREKAGMSQAAFAAAFRLNRRTLQQWEQGKGTPDLAVRAYLKVIERNPQAVREALDQ